MGDRHMDMRTGRDLSSQLKIQNLFPFQVVEARAAHLEAVAEAVVA